MGVEAPRGLLRRFHEVEDPRVERTKLHRLPDILVITLCAVICGADSWTEIELFGKAKFDWLRTFLELPNGIPSHDTFGRVFSRLNPEQLERCFLSWMQALAQASGGRLGRSLRAGLACGRGRGVSSADPVLINPSPFPEPSCLLIATAIRNSYTNR